MNPILRLDDFWKDFAPKGGSQQDGFYAGALAVLLLVSKDIGIDLTPLLDEATAYWKEHPR